MQNPATDKEKFVKIIETLASGTKEENKQKEPCPCYLRKNYLNKQSVDNMVHVLI